MPEYRVRWEIDIEADTPQEAACKARVSATKEDTTATVFEVEERLTVGRAEARGEFDVRWTPSFPHCNAYTIEEAEALDAAAHPLEIGTRIRSVQGEWDDDDGKQRHTGPDAIGEVISNEQRDGRGFVYGVLFPNGTQVFLDQFGELDDMKRYEIMWF